MAVGPTVKGRSWNVLPGDRTLDQWGQDLGVKPGRGVILLSIPAWARIATSSRRTPSITRSTGWHAVAAQRTALLDSLRQGVAGWR
jgi:hypothetical protein